MPNQPNNQQPPYGQPYNQQYNQYYNPQYNQPYGQPPMPQTAPIQEVKSPSNGIGKAGFFFSLGGFCLGLVPYVFSTFLYLSWLPFMGWPLWLIGLVLSFIGVFRYPKGLAIAGLVISLVEVIIVLYLVTLCDTYLPMDFF